MWVLYQYINLFTKSQMLGVDVEGGEDFLLSALTALTDVFKMA